MDDAQKARLAQNEDLFRGLNEGINEAAEAHGSDSHMYEFLCECCDVSCVERVHLTLAEYAHIRAAATRFVVQKNHVVREIEHVVEVVPDHMVIEKHGEAGRVAVQLEAEADARSR
ncbi:MAG TPA: hypothetical protein VM290_04920 [Gaiellaceae bacterium]|jgi:hypothetical protein|nr:hypothetical protein [Gaiellaceae bacterium]